MSASIKCVCGGKYTKSHKSSHFKTKLHISYIPPDKDDYESDEPDELDDPKLFYITDPCAICLESIYNNWSVLTSCSHRICIKCLSTHAINTAYTSVHQLARRSGPLSVHCPGPLSVHWPGPLSAHLSVRLLEPLMKYLLEYLSDHLALISARSKTVVSTLH